MSFLDGGRWHYDPPMDSWSLTELPSGVRVVTERLPGIRSVALGYWVAVGARDETAATAGVSHFIEHLLFRGSPSYTALEVAELFDELGGELNAATSREHTEVYARIPDHGLERALDVMGEMLFAPLFDDLDAEREVVLEEIAMYDDTPQDLVHDLLGEAVFGSHPLGRPVIGTAEVISSVTREALSSYHRSGYAPGKIVLAAAGNVDHDRLVELADAAVTRHAPPTPAPHVRELLTQEPAPGLRVGEKDTEQYHVCRAAPGLARTDPRRFAAAILDAILGSSASSRLFQEIREKRGMAYSVYSFTSSYAETGQVGLYVGTREENLEEALKIAGAEIADIAGGNLRPRELERAQENLKGRMLLSLESTSARMSRLGKALITDVEILTPEQVIAEVDAVDADAVCSLAATLLAPGRLSAAGIGPREDRFLAALEGIAPGLAEAA